MQEARARPQAFPDVGGRPRGKFITLEGGEGVGKSTQIGRLSQRLAALGIEVVATREPGGSERAELLRGVLLSNAIKPLGRTAEAILFGAARIDHIDKIVEPALSAGKWVVSDRFSDSTRAYQGGASEIDPRLLNALERVTLAEARPDLTLILDLPAEEGLARAARRRAAKAPVDRFEGEHLHFHEALRAAFLAIARSNPERCAIIDASASEVEVAEAIGEAVRKAFLAVTDLDGQDAP